MRTGYTTIFEVAFSEDTILLPATLLFVTITTSALIISRGSIASPGMRILVESVRKRWRERKRVLFMLLNARTGNGVGFRSLFS